MAHNKICMVELGNLAKIKIHLVTDITAWCNLKVLPNINNSIKTKTLAWANKTTLIIHLSAMIKAEITNLMEDPEMIISVLVGNCKVRLLP